MTTTDEHLSECADPVVGEVALPEYAVTVAECGDPQLVSDELTEWLHEQTSPQIPTEPEETAEDIQRLAAALIALRAEVVALVEGDDDA